MSGKDDFDDEGLPLLPKHTKVRLPRPARAPRGRRVRHGEEPSATPHGPRLSPRRLAPHAFRSRGFFRATRAGDAMRARARRRARGRAAMRTRFPRPARIRCPKRASHERRRRRRVSRPLGSLAHARGARKEIFPSVASDAKDASRDFARRPPASGPNRLGASRPSRLTVPRLRRRRTRRSASRETTARNPA